ncbi:ChbG/HpnK family deacetylase [Bordetella holmesii]|uniref:YdjC-like protein n=3 Tax=Bordetella holmesii TaxID=35814 RepID=A0A158M1Q5_9BORD|nr:ChbG/HpnK family deacetylase [Bordetella holmesii]AHV91052.1 ydjC-like family protein [Bordetella holmesii ATCC 51541]EWM44385.1 ydjC-like family protein [Bordetella holmesii 41130]EWM47341.1 ydjC-like family protein [Bordetella holmesii 35009]KAK70980.1 YdjC-like protein [Bordetella holmesii H620]KCV01200.1 YdjC-like protein [Bordetella holmesii CDC-H629-BH]
MAMKTSAQGRRVAVCGDDFGMDACIDHAIFQLLDAGILSAVSCMSGGASFARHVAQLKASDTDIGLHLNLSEPLSAADRDMLPLCALLVRAYAGRLDPQRISQAIERQLDAFEDEMGQAPHYIDGHQHVHQLPGVRGPLLQALQRRYPGQRPWLRLTQPGALQGLPWAAVAKAHVIAGLGGHALAGQLCQQGWPANGRFFGAYGFTGGKRHYATLLHHWLANALDGDLIMCHPALPGPVEHGQQRVAEFEVLASAELREWLVGNGLSVTRLSQMIPVNASQRSARRLAWDEADRPVISR